MKEIAETGYWNGETAHIHHVHCKELSKWICEFLNVKISKDESIRDLACFTKNSKVKSLNGDINIEDIKKGDIIYDIYFKEVIVNEVFKKLANNRVNISTNIGNNLEWVETTSEHPFLGIKRKDVQASKYKDARRSNIKKENETDIYNNPYFIKVKDLEIKDLIAIPRQIGTIKEEILSKLLGFYLAEGSVLYSHKPHIGGILLTFNIKEKEFGEEAKKYAMALGATSVTIKERIERSTLEVFIFGKELGTLIVNLGGKLSDKKEIHSKVKKWDNESKLNIIKYWLKGDGHKHKKSNIDNKIKDYWVGKTVSKKLAKDLLSLSRDIGINPTLNVEIPKQENRKNIYKLLFNNSNYNFLEGINEENKIRSWRKTDNFIFLTIKNIKNIENEEEVFNLNVTGSNTYICENFAVHNCGLGNYLKDLQEFGFTNLAGFEADPPKHKVFNNILKQDLTIPFTFSPKGVVISLECGEHISKKYMNEYLDNITNNCSNYLIMSWAIRGQAGFGHVNCLDNHEIIPLIESRGFKLMEKETEEIRNINLSEAPWFKNTLLIFKKK